MTRQSAEALKLEIREEQLKASQPLVGIGTQASDEPSRPENRLALGIRDAGKGNYVLEIRVQRDGGRARREAEKIVERANGEANIAIQQVIQIPPEAALLDSVQSWQGSASLRRRVRPATVGVSVGHEDGGAGTLGGFVQDGNGALQLLSNNHVLARSGRATRGDWVYQPGRTKGMQFIDDHRIARLARFTIPSRQQVNYTDAAVATLENENDCGGNRIPAGLNGAGRQLSLGQIEEVTDGLVHKVGRTTGLTTGRISSESVDGLVVRSSLGNLLFDDVFEVEPEAGETHFSAPGDSGSAIFDNDRKVIGLLFAGGPSQPLNGGPAIDVSYGCRIQTVLSDLGVTWLV